MSITPTGALRAFAIPALTSLSLGLSGGCDFAPGETPRPSPSPTITQTPTDSETPLPCASTCTPEVTDTPTLTPHPTDPSLCRPTTDTTVTSSSSCSPRYPSCCPTEAPGRRADEIAGAWRLTEGGDYQDCGAWTLEGVGAAHPSSRIEPTSCYAITRGEMRIGEELAGCFDLYSQWGSYHYGEFVYECAVHDLAVEARNLGEGGYKIRLLSSQAFLELNCTLEADVLDCSESSEGFKFERGEW